MDKGVPACRLRTGHTASRAGAAEPIRRPYLSTPINRLVRTRVVWLFFLAISAALTVGDVRARDIGRVLLREVRVGAVLGLTLGAIAFLTIMGVSLFSESYTAPIGLTVGLATGLIVYFLVAKAILGI